MPKKIPYLAIRVGAGRSAQFPIDMLRYDGARPRREEDSHKIQRSLDYRTQDDAPMQEIEVVVTANSAPCADRWRSFGWVVTHVRDEASDEWLPYYGQRVFK